MIRPVRQEITFEELNLLKKIFYLKHFITNYPGKLLIRSYLGKIAVDPMYEVLNLVWCP